MGEGAPHSEKYGFSLKGVSFEDCISKVVKIYAGIQIKAHTCGHVAAEKDGMTVLSTKSYTMEMSTGQTIENPMFTQFDFNADGKIVAYRSSYDTSILRQQPLVFRRLYK